ncbi:MAG TPA: peptidylprolyl isomerase [Candidatus Hypogeohydataceae bacterium YC40]
MLYIFCVLIFLPNLFPSASMAAQDTIPPELEEMAVPGGDIVAEVNGQKITRQELSEFLIESFGEEALDVLIRRVVIHQQAQKLGITADPQEVNQRVNALLEGEIGRLVKTWGMKDQAELSEELSKKGMDLPTLKERTAARIRKAMEGEILLEKLVERTVTVTDEELRQAFEDEYGEKIEAAQIVVSTKKDAEEILKKLKAGADFDILARNESIDRLSAANGGKMRPFGPNEGVFGPATAKLEKGQLSDIIKTDDGYHILKVINKKPRGNEQFNDVKPALEKLVKQRIVRKRREPWLDSLLERSEIKKYLITY